MIEKSLRTSIKSTKVKDMEVVYHLFFKNALYGIECYVEGSFNKNDYCYIENITDDEGEAEAFLKMVVKKEVLPIHIKDMAEDYFA